MNTTNESAFSVGSLYLAGFAQVRAPHVGVLIPTSTQSGVLAHIRIDRTVSPKWIRQIRVQNLTNDMFLTSLLKIGNGVTVERLCQEAEEVPVPDNGEFGECGPWAMQLVGRLIAQGLIRVPNIDALRAEFETFVAGNRSYARRDKFPNVTSSSYCEFTS